MPTSGSRDRIGASPSPVSISFKTILTEDGNSWISNISIQRMWRPERRAIGISTWSRMLWVPDNYLPAPFVQYLLSIWGQKKSPITWKRQDVKVTIALSSSMIMRWRKNSRRLHQVIWGEAPSVRCFLLATLEMLRNLSHFSKVFWISTSTSIQRKWDLIQTMHFLHKNASKEMTEKAGTSSWSWKKLSNLTECGGSQLWKANFAI